jgi:hypothetical protein
MSGTRKNSITFSQTRKGSMVRNRVSFNNASRSDPWTFLKDVEKANIIEMNKCYVKMTDQLEYFRYDKQDFEELHDQKGTEMLNINRFIKKEVIDMADRMDDMQETIQN